MQLSSLLLGISVLIKGGGGADIRVVHEIGVGMGRKC